MSGVAAAKPLTGVRVLELGQLIAGPFASSLLGYYGAEVIKIEDPKLGDPIRSWRGVADDGTSVWWRSIGRNKKSITLDLRIPKAQQIVRDLSKSCDVIIENFKPGTMEKWGLSPEQLQKENPGLIFTRVSGYGQTGPMASKPGFASVCEAFGGLRHVTGFKGEAPVRSNISIGDSLAGLHAAFGITLALLARANKKNPSHHIGRGQVVDVAIYESGEYKESGRCEKV